MLLALSVTGCHQGFSGENHNLWDIEWRQQALERLSTPRQLPLGEQTFGGEGAFLGRKEGAHQGEGHRHSPPLQGFPQVQGCCGPDLPLPGSCCRPGDGTLLTTLVWMSPVYFVGVSAPSPSTQLRYR